jgi:hypothetical protein
MVTIISGVIDQVVLYLKDDLNDLKGNAFIKTIFHDFGGNLDTYVHSSYLQQEKIGYKDGLTGKIYQRKDYIQMRLNALNYNDFINFIENLINNVIDKEENKVAFCARYNPMFKKYQQWNIEKIGDKYLIDSDYVITEIPEISLSFEQIKVDIIENLKNAKLCIWAAIAWLTDREILQVLYDKQKEGIDIQIIVYDDIEKKANGKMPEYEKGFKNVYRIPAEIVDKGCYIRKDKMMHLKLFIIDLELVAMGSYNWTDQATRNYEGILKVKHRKTAYEAALEFVRIKGEFLKNKK